MTIAIPRRSPQAYAPADWAPPEPTSWDRTVLDPITRRLPVIGQINPWVAERLRMQTGRHLAGLGAMQNQGAATSTIVDPDTEKAYYNEEIPSMEKDDDVFGSGIFDDAARLPTVHRDLGIFGDNPSIPGYIGREVQYAISREVSDVASGADVVVVAGGGLTFQERGGRQAYFDRFGPTPCPPDFQIAHRATDVQQPYSRLIPAGPIKPGPDGRVTLPYGASQDPRCAMSGLGHLCPSIVPSMPPKPPPLVPTPYIPILPRQRTYDVGMRSIANIEQIPMSVTNPVPPPTFPTNERMQMVPARDNSGQPVTMIPGPMRPIPGVMPSGMLVLPQGPGVLPKGYKAAGYGPAMHPSVAQPLIPVPDRSEQPGLMPSQISVPSGMLVLPQGPGVLPRAPQGAPGYGVSKVPAYGPMQYPVASVPTSPLALQPMPYASVPSQAVVMGGGVKSVVQPQMPGHPWVPVGRNGQPLHPVQPQLPSRPLHPVHPMHPVHPLHPVQPMLPARPLVPVPASGRGEKKRPAPPIPLPSSKGKPAPKPPPPHPSSMKGFGAEPAPVGWGTFLFAGLLVGAAGAVFYGAVSGQATKGRTR